MLKRVSRLAAQEQRVKVAKDEGVTRADLAYGQVKYTSPLSWEMLWLMVQALSHSWNNPAWLVVNFFIFYFLFFSQLGGFL